MPTEGAPPRPSTRGLAASTFGPSSLAGDALSALQSGMVRHAAIVLTSLLFACGGNVVFETDGAGGGTTSVDDGTGTGIVASSGQGGSFSVTTSGPTTTGATTTGVTTGGDPTCPAEKPTGSEPCPIESQVCDYGGFCNFVICSGGFWSFPVC